MLVDYEFWVLEHGGSDKIVGAAVSSTSLLSSLPALLPLCSLLGFFFVSKDLFPPGLVGLDAHWFICPNA